MDGSSLEALVYDPSKCSKLSLEQKRELIYEVSRCSDGATEMLQAWSRQEILQILCAELGKERKYTGLTKSKIIEHLLKIVYEKKSQEQVLLNASEGQPSFGSGERTAKRQRKSDHPNRLPSAANVNVTSGPEDDSDYTIYCKNSACKAKLSRDDVFCKRCSCCICRQYDDNKDPSLWLVCNSDPPFHGASCGMSCHLECALKHENSGISKDRQDKGLDGSFCCVSCGKVNDLLSSWRKQMVVTRDTRRVDILCYRLSLGQKILAGTKHYQNLYELVDEAVTKLQEDVGPLTGLPVKKARGIVNRLSSGPEIQRLCASAVESLDLTLSNRVLESPSDCNMLAMKLVKFEDIRPSSLTVILNSDDSNMGNVVGYNLWHRKADYADYPIDPTCQLFASNTTFLLSGLTPDTQYFLKVVALAAEKEMGSFEFQFRTGAYPEGLQNPNSNSSQAERSQSPTTNCSSLSNPSSVEDEDSNRGDNYLPFCNTSAKPVSVILLGDSTNCSDQSQKETNGDMVEEHSMGTKGNAMRNKESSNGPMGEETSTDNGSNGRTGLECVPYVDSLEAGLPITPCKLENVKDGAGRNNRSKFSGKDIDDGGSKRDEEPQAGSSSKKRSVEMREEDCIGIGDKDFEYYVKIIRCLECDGHIKAEFRQKFLTWYSLRATPKEARIVKVFIDTFIEDPESLAGQLVDTFSDVVLNKRCSGLPARFCMKLWH